MIVCIRFHSNMILMSRNVDLPLYRNKTSACLPVCLSVCLSVCHRSVGRLSVFLLPIHYYYHSLLTLKTQAVPLPYHTVWW